MSFIKSFICLIFLGLCACIANGQTIPVALTPFNEQVFGFTDSPIFTWVPSSQVSGSLTSYSLNIYKMEDQTASEAIASNPSLFVEQGITSNLCIYPAYAPRLVPGTWYAWQVKLTIISSNIDEAAPIQQELLSEPRSFYVCDLPDPKVYKMRRCSALEHDTTVYSIYAGDTLLVMADSAREVILDTSRFKVSRYSKVAGLPYPNKPIHGIGTYKSDPRLLFKTWLESGQIQLRTKYCFETLGSDGSKYLINFIFYPERRRYY